MPCHIFAWSTLAFAQPLYDMLTRTPEFFVARGLSPSQILLLATLVLLAPTALAVAIAEPIGAVLGARRGAYLGALGLCACALALLLLRRTPLDSTYGVLGAAVVGSGLFVWTYLRFSWMRTLSSLLAVLALVPPLAFLFAPPIARLLAEDKAPSFALGSEASGSSDSPPSVVMVVLDELPAGSLVGEDGRVDATLFPHLADFESTATRYPDNAAAAIKTLEALPALLTGRYPKPDLVPTVQDYPGNLFTLLAGSREIHAFEPRTRLCPDELRWKGPPAEVSPVLADLGVLYLHLVLPSGLAAHLPDVTTNWNQLDALAEKSGPIEAFLRSLPTSRDDPQTPALVFLHAELPHHPWIYLPSGHRYYPGAESSIDGIAGADAPLPGRWVDDRWAIRQGLQRHLLQTAFADRLVGQLLQRLRDAGIFDEALIVVTADHGISFRPGTKVRALEQANLEDIAGVPLWIKRPGQRTASVDPRPTSAVDLLPTIAATLDIRPPWQVDGADLGALAAAGLESAPIQRPRVTFNQPTEGLLLEEELPPPEERFSATEHRRAFPAEPPSSKRLFRLVPDASTELLEMLGSEVATRLVEAPVPETELRAELDDPARYVDVDPEADLLPSRVTGHLVGGVSRDPKDRPILALSLNGQVQAVTLPRLDPTAAGSFSFLVDETGWRKGNNQPALFEVVKRAGGTPQLHPIEVPPVETYELLLDGTSAVAIESSTGQRFEIQSPTQGGVTDRVFADRDAWISYRVVLAPGRGAPAPRSVLVFGDEGFLRADALPRHDPRLGTFFRFDLPREQARGRLRFFLLDDGGQAHPLEFHSVRSDEEPGT